MIKRALIIGLMVALGTLVMASNPTQNYIGKTPQQLSGFTVGDTNIGSSTWWYNYTFKQLSALFYAHNLQRHSGDYSSFQAALDSGGVVVVDPGDTVTQTQTRLDPGSNIAIIGNGPSSVIKWVKSSATASQLFYVENDSNLIFQNLKFFGDTTDTYDSEHDHQIAIIGSKNVIITGCIFELSSGDNIYMDTAENIIITDCIFKIMPRYASGSWQSGRNNIAIVNGKNIIISNCKFSGGNPACIDLEPNAGDSVRAVTITGCTFGDDETYTITDGVITDAGQGFRGVAVLANSSSSETSDVTVLGNTFYSSNGVEIDRASGDSLYNINVVGNAFRKCTRGVWLYRDAQDVIINDNTFDKCQYGVLMSARHRNVLVDGNKFSACTSYAMYDGVTAINACSLTTISNNIVYDCTNGFRFTYPHRFKITGNTITGGATGIQCNTSAYHLVITNNLVRECTSRGIYVYGGSGTENKYVTIANNQCYNNTSRQIEVTYTDFLNLFGNTAYDTSVPVGSPYQIYLAYIDTSSIVGNFTVPDSGGIYFTTSNTYADVGHNFTRATAYSANTDMIKHDWHSSANLYYKSQFRDSGELRGNTYLKGIGTFNSTDQTDVVTITGATAGDYYVVTPIGTHNANDVLSVTAESGQITVTRLAGGTSGLQYYYIRVGE